MSHAHRLYRLLVSVLVASMLLGPAQAPITLAAPDAPAAPAATAQPQSSGLYRTRVVVDALARRARLEKLEVAVLSEGPGWAVVLADADQLESLARLRFEPRASDDLAWLTAAAGPAKAWLTEGLQPLLGQAEAVQQQAVVETAGVAAPAAVTALRAATQAVTPEQAAGITALPSNDFDGDGLTDTEEAWWCTDPMNPNSDGDAAGYTDGQEVAALLDFTLPREVRWGYGPPFRAWPPFVDTIAPGATPTCLLDSDHDSIPDLAETYMVGTRVPLESSDRDKFDDGQELFGVTYCTPAGTDNCGWGLLPRNEDYQSDFITEEMPRWVLPPGDNPLVAAFPVPEVYVTPGSWHVERVTMITTSLGEMTQTSNSYETSVTRGESSSIADTVNWNNWEEVSQAVETPLPAAAGMRPQWAVPLLFQVARVFGPRVALGALGRQVGGFLVKQGLSGVLKTVGTGVATSLIADKLKGAFSGDDKKDNVEIKNTIQNVNVNNVSSSAEANASVTLNQNFDFQGVVNSLDGVQYAINQQGDLLARGLYDISYAISQPRYTETRTNGHSWGGAQTTTHEVYEEHTQTEGVGFSTGQNWSTAWAVDSSHAADLTFEFSVKNTGTEYARELSGIVVNVYIGDDTSPSISYPAWEKFPNGKLENLFPVGPNTPSGQFSTRTFTTNPIALSLEQMKRIDLGERLTVKVESYSYGADELFYTNAVTGGVTVFIEDGVEDGDEMVDSYVIPTWGVESVQDVLTRYFRCPPGQTCTDADGNLNALWTPEYDGVNPPTWHEHYLSDIAWWNVYLTQADAGDTSLQDLPAQAGSGILFRFNRDADRDGYNDRAEFRYYCALPADDPDHARCADAHLRPEIHPQPEVSAGYVAERSGNVVTVKLAVANGGTFDAYGIDAVMYSPDGTTTIGNNTVGGNGRVRPGNHVAVGSLIKPPDLANWGASTAKPYAGGQFSGAADRTFTFTASTPGVVGQGATAMTWSDGAGGSGTVNLGSSYHAPLPVDVAQGLQIGVNTGTIAAGARFTVQALTPRDTFTYTVNSEPFTPPVIVVSYSDPQGSHRFVTPVELASLDAGIAAGQMLEGLKVEIVTPAAFNAAGANTTNLVVNNPHPATIQGGHLYLNFVSDGKLVREKAYTLDIPAGPTVFPADWSVTEFSADYHPTGDNLLIAFWTDSEGNIIDSAARPFSSFAEDPKPAFTMADADATWDFGTAQQGTLLKRSFAFANTGALDLLTYVSAPAGLTVSQTGSRRVGPADMTTYEMALNTANLTVGPYDGTITIRTSDPNARERTVHVVGTVTAAAADTPVGAMQRPLDTAATVSGMQGQWVDFAHTLGPEPQTLHPVKVFGQDGVLKGVGKYATSFGAGTASYDMFGDGRDGVMPSSANLDNNNGVGVGVVNSGSFGSYSINVSDAYGVGRINPGDAVLIHQTQGSGAGCWEINKTVSDFGGGTATYQLVKPLQCNYASGGNNHAQIQRVPQYTDCPVSGTVTPLSGWNGSWGGIFAVMCNISMRVSGSISAEGAGFRGGVGQGVNLGGQNGESTDGFVGRGGTSGGGLGSYGGGSGANTSNRSPAGPRSGGAGSGCYDYLYDGQGDEGTGGGGGGGNATAGGGGGGGGDSNAEGGWGGAAGSSAGGGHGGNQSRNGGNGGDNATGFTGTGGNSDGSSNRGTGGGGGGAAIGADDGMQALFGSGGGATGAYQGKGVGHRIGRNGGNGGGLVFVAAPSVEISGIMTAKGQTGQSTDGRAGSGGGGAGGHIIVRARDISEGTNGIQALGGGGGTPSGAAGGGGQGGNGRVRVEYCGTASGASTPPATTQKLNCYIADQAADPTHGLLNLPASGTNTYQVQYGRKLNWTSATSQETKLRVPAGLSTSVTLQALVNDLPSNASFALDVGEPYAACWSPTVVGNNSENLSPNLAACFNAYWASNGAPTTGYLDVPVHVTLDRAGQVLLTNLQVTPTGSTTRAIRLPVRPQGYSNVAASFTVSGGTGPLAVGVDVGGDGSVDWTYTGTPAYPASLTTGNLAAAVNAYLAGKSGDVDVPLRFYLSPFATLNLTGFTATPVGQPDAQVGASDVSFSAPTPTEGDELTVNATLHNLGTLDTGPLTASFYATPPGGIALYIGSRFVENVAAAGTATVPLQWNTLGFTGDVAVRVTVDPYNRLAESSETNNQATANLTIKTRPDLQLTDFQLSDPEPVAGEAIIVTLPLRNNGETTAAGQTVALYDGNPDAGGTVVGAGLAPALPGGATTPVTFTWTPAAPGLHRLTARADRDHQVGEFDEGNNDRIAPIHVGVSGPLLLDSGVQAADPPYSATAGYGAVDEGQPDVAAICGTGTSSAETLRRDPGGRVVYRFDNLLPGHFYHLDTTLYECDGAHRQETIKVDGNALLGPVDLTDALVHRFSTRLDPALYADRTISVAVEAPGINGAVVSQVNLHDVDYRYADAGASGDLIYSAGRGYGWLDGIASSAWGLLPYQNVRVNQSGNELRYRFDNLAAAKRYQVNLTLYQGDAVNVIEEVLVDGLATGVVANLSDRQPHYLAVEVPVEAYRGDGSIVVTVRRTNGTTGAFANEIALEEKTLLNLPVISDLQVTNVTAKQATISWLTDAATDGAVHFGTTATLGGIALDERGTPVSARTHQVTLVNLAPQTAYNFYALSSDAIDDHGGAYYQFTTGPAFAPNPSDLAYGRVLRSDGSTLAAGALVRAKLRDSDAQGSPGDSALRSALVESSGFWSFDLAESRTTNYSQLFDYSPAGDRLILDVTDGAGCTASQIIDTGLDAPAPDMILVCPTQVTHSVAAGWTLLGLSIQGDLALTAETALDDIVAQSGSAIEIERWWNGGWDAHVRDLPFNNFALELGRGYFVRASATSAWTRNGRPPVAPLPVNFYPGWNLVSLPKLPAALDAEGLLVGIAAQGGACSEVDRWDSPTGSWKGHPKGVPINLFTLSPIEGYFVKCTKQSTYTPGATTLANSGPVQPPAPEVTEVEPAADPVIFDVTVTNLRDVAFSVTWRTDQPSKDWLAYRMPGGSETFAQDDRGAEVVSTIHQVTVANLSPETTYAFRVHSGNSVAERDGNGQPFQAVTAATTPPGVPLTAFGQVLGGDGQPAAGALVRGWLVNADDTRSTPLSALVESAGYWALSLPSEGCEDKQLALSAFGTDGTVAQGLTPACAEGVQPAPTLTLQPRAQLPIYLPLVVR